MSERLYMGDCITVMRQLIDEGIKVDAVICDIPYGIHNNKFDTVIPFEEMWDCIHKLIKPKGNVVLFGSGLFTAKLMMSNEKEYRYDLIWKKSKCGSPLTAKYMPLKKHEHIVVFGEPASYYEPQMSKGEPYKRKYTPNKKNNLGYGINGVQTDNKGTRHPTTILDFPQKWRRQDQIHPTQKPVELMEFLVKSYCPENGIVLDFCAGSGSTGVACINTNRNFIGIEIDEDYFKIMKDRIEKTKLNK
jgi:site-specific DNA-methyltransferase (adenine-specific)